MLILWKNTLENTGFTKFCTLKSTLFPQVLHIRKNFDIFILVQSCQKAGAQMVKTEKARI